MGVLNAHEAIEFKDVWFSYHGRDQALKGIDLTVDPGSSVALVGVSGSGKTTLLKIINGLLKPDKGSVKLFGFDIKDIPNRRGTHCADCNYFSEGSCRRYGVAAGLHDICLRRRIGYIPQQLGLLRNSTVLKNVLIGALPRMGAAEAFIGFYSEEEIEYAKSCIGSVGLTHKLDERVYRLSGGERQRVAIARALMQRPSIILADELTSDLDYVTAESVMTLMCEAKEERRELTLVMATHNLDLAIKYSEKVVGLRGGVKVAEIAVADHTPKDLVGILS